MEQLHENAARIWKVLSQFQKGTTAKRLQQITSMSRTATYNALKELQSKGFITHEKKLYKIVGKSFQERSPVRVKTSRFGLAKILKDWREARRLEKEVEKIERLINFDVYCRLISKYHPELDAFEDWADQVRESRKHYYKKKTG